MKQPEVPVNEPSRLQALRSLNILDTDREERFDRITRLTRRLFKVPVAMISFADEHRMWFKSTAGIEITEIPRDISFCGHVILHDEVFIIPDAKQDERFADNPGVVGESGIRFYAGCPFSHPDGSRLGTLSLCDHRPRQLSDEEIETLRDLTSIVASELRAAHLATLDELTGLFNRRGFLTLAEQSLKLCQRQKSPASLVFLDLNDFKAINDRFGHETGDRALHEFADKLREVFRDSDICARLSGDEFVVLLPNTAEDDAQEVRRRFMEMLALDNRCPGRQYLLECSSGIVEFDPLRHAGLEDLLRAGDERMYQAKGHYRSGWPAPDQDDTAQ